MVRAITAKERESRKGHRALVKHMRRNQVTAEKLFWSEIRNRKLGGFKFKRQFLIGRYIVDFVCLERKLIVELDGPFHARRANYDEVRDAFLRRQGYRVLRFANDCVGGDFGIVLATVKHELESDAPSP